MKNKLISAFLVGALACGITVAGANQAIQAIQNTEIKVTLNGQVQNFKDETTGETQYPITYNNRTYLPLRNVCELAGLDVDYDSNTKTAILNNKGTSNNNDEKKDWKWQYIDIIRSVSDTWEYNEQTKFGFAYLKNDEIPELVFGSPNTSLLIYSYDIEKGCVYLLTSCQTGVRGATSITYIEKENIIINKSGGMLFDSETEDKPGCLYAFGTWGTMTNLDSGWEDSWSNSTYVFDEDDRSKDIEEISMSEEVEQYLTKEKDFDLKYTKNEIENVIKYL